MSTWYTIYMINNDKIIDIKFVELILKIKLSGYETFIRLTENENSYIYLNICAGVLHWLWLAGTEDYSWSWPEPSWLWRTMWLWWWPGASQDWIYDHTEVTRGNNRQIKIFRCKNYTLHLIIIYENKIKQIKFGICQAN